MPTYVPIEVNVGETGGGHVWKTGKVTEYEIGEALKMFLLKCIIDKDCRTDFEYIFNEIGEFAEKICNEIESQWFCIISARLKTLYYELLNLQKSFAESV